VVVSFVFPSALDAILHGSIDLEAVTLKLQAIDTDEYSPAASTTDDFLADVPSAARIESPVALTGALVQNAGLGVDVAVVIPAVADSEPPIGALLVYRDTGSEATSNLLLWIDTAIGLPLTPTGADVEITLPTTLLQLVRAGGSFLYPAAFEALLRGELALESADVRMLRIDTDEYLPAAGTTDAFLSAIPAPARLGSAVALSGEAVVAAAFDATTPVTFTSVSTAEADTGAFVLYVHTGSDATARLLWFVRAGLGAPLVPTGQDMHLHLPPAGFVLGNEGA
jgi:hypothetical protein